MSASRNVFNSGNRQGSIRFFDQFATAGAGVDPTLVTGNRPQDTLSVVSIGDGSEIGYRITLRAGTRKYDAYDPSAVRSPTVNNGAGAAYVVNAAQLNDTAGPLGLPGKNQFDIVLYTLAGANVQTAGVGIGWALDMENRSA